MVDIIPSHATSSRCFVRLGCEYDVMVHSTGGSAQSLRLGRRYTVPGNNKKKHFREFYSNLFDIFSVLN